MQNVTIFAFNFPKYPKYYFKVRTKKKRRLKLLKNKTKKILNKKQGIF
jgi:hypothetical protein